jgi:DNA-binding CsgD family transcriptional regulator
MGVFVGRARELGVLGAAAAAARRGQPRVVLVEADGGAGKSSLLMRFAAGLGDAAVLRASGDEAELLVPYGVVGQLLTGARMAGARMAGARMAGGRLPELLASDLTGDADPLAVGAELVMSLGRLRGARAVLLAVIDDLQWADSRSARALLFALRRLHADPVLVVLSARPGELSRLGESWQRFLAGDYRASRIRLAGLGPGDLEALSRALGAGELTGRAVGRLIDYTAGNPLYCRALLEEFGAEGLDRPDGGLRVPRALAGVLLLRVSSLTRAARDLVVSTAVLGGQCPLRAAAALAGQADPLPALEEAVAAGILAEDPGGPGGPASQITFTHLLMQRAVYEELSPISRRQLHGRAAALVGRDKALGHRVAAAVGPDDGLAAELEAAALESSRLGRTAQAAALLAQAAAASSQDPDGDRRLLDALEILVSYGEVAEAEILAARVAALPAGARRSGLLGALDLLADRPAAAEPKLLEAWQAHDRDREAHVGAASACLLVPLCLNAGRASEAIEWGERAVGAHGVPPALRHRALGILALALVFDGRVREGLARLGFLPAAPSEVAREDTDALVLRGMTRELAEDLPAAIADLSAAAARLRAGVRSPFASQCLSCLADAEYRFGAWDDALLHGELAVSLAHDADRAWDFGFVHAYAASVPAARGDWDVAAAHVRLATDAAQGLGVPEPIAAAATAQARLAIARGDLAGAVAAAATIRATGKAECLGRPGHYEWRSSEIDALIGLGRLGQAEAALAEFDAVLARGGPTSATVAAARLRGDLAVAAGRPGAASDAFEVAWSRAEGLPVPLSFALLEISDGRRLRAAGDQDMATARLLSARRRLAKLAARPYLDRCDRELAASGAPVACQEIPALPGLTPAELAVARLVATGRSNRQAAAELYVSVKTVEFHLGHIFAKLGIRSRRELISALRESEPVPVRNQGRA